MTHNDQQAQEEEQRRADVCGDGCEWSTRGYKVCGRTCLEQMITECNAANPQSAMYVPRTASGYGTEGYAPDGRPLFIGTTPYAEWCRPHQDSNKGET